MTGGGGAEIKFGGGGHEKFIYVNSRGHGGTKSLFEYGSNEKGEDQKKRSSVQKFPQILVVVSKFLRNHEFLSATPPPPPKKMSSSQKFYEIRCESTKTTKKQFLLANSRAVNTDLKVLGLDLHSSGPELVNFFGAQSSLRGHTSSHLGGNGPGMPPPPPLALGLRYVGHEDELKDGQEAESR